MGNGQSLVLNPNTNLRGCRTTCGKFLKCEGLRNPGWYVLPIFTLILCLVAFGLTFAIPGVDLSNGMVIGILVSTIIAAIFAAVLIYYVYKYNSSCFEPVANCGGCAPGSTGEPSASDVPLEIAAQ